MAPRITCSNGVGPKTYYEMFKNISRSDDGDNVDDVVDDDDGHVDNEDEIEIKIRWK